MLTLDNSNLRRGYAARIPICSVLQREHHVGWLGERGSLDLAPIGYPRTTAHFRMRHVIQLATTPSPPIAKADISVAAGTSYPRVIGPVTTLLIYAHDTLPSNPTTRTKTTNHELLHPSRILDARADWCVYKSIRQLPLDYPLRQPASDRGKCSRRQLIPQNRKEGRHEGPVPRRSRQTNTRVRSSHRQSLRRNTNTKNR